MDKHYPAKDSSGLPEGWMRIRAFADAACDKCGGFGSRRLYINGGDTETFALCACVRMKREIPARHECPPPPRAKWFFIGCFSALAINMAVSFAVATWWP